MIHPACTMEKDCQRAKNKFVHKYIDLIEDLNFANPVQKLKAIQAYCCDLYGAMLWDFHSLISLKKKVSNFKPPYILLSLVLSITKSLSSYTTKDAALGIYK